jgi:putative ABC transport system substrate-binding protein
MRRLLVAMLGIALSILPGTAQIPGKVYHIGILTHGAVPDPTDPPYRRAVEGARLLGMDEGRNVQLHWGAAKGDDSQLPILARELVAKHVDIVVAIGDGAARAIKDATEQIPVVIVAGDPVATGLVGSLAKPGGNLTGVVVYGSAADVKRLEMVVENFGKGKRIAYLIDATARPATRQNVEQAASKLGVDLVVFRAESASDYDAVFRAMHDAGVGALLLSTSMNFLVDRNDLTARAAAARLPMMCHWREMAQAGCVAAFGTSLEWVFGRVVDYMIRIMLYGQKPGDLPVEQASKFQLVVNLKIAKALGLILPSEVLARADELIE